MVKSSWDYVIGRRTILTPQEKQELQKQQLKDLKEQYFENITIFRNTLIKETRKRYHLSYRKLGYIFGLSKSQICIITKS